MTAERWQRVKTMRAERWQRVKALFEEVLAAEEDRRGEAEQPGPTPPVTVVTAGEVADEGAGHPTTL